MQFFYIILFLNYIYIYIYIYIYVCVTFLEFFIHNALCCVTQSVLNDRPCGFRPPEPGHYLCKNTILTITPTVINMQRKHIFPSSAESLLYRVVTHSNAPSLFLCLSIYFSVESWPHLTPTIILTISFSVMQINAKYI